MNRPESGFGTTGSALIGASLFLATFGCAAVGLGEPESEIIQLGGDYTGTLSIMGEQLFGNLSIRQNGEDLDLSFNFPEMGIQARGEGVVTHDGFSAKVSYTRPCPGEARLSAVKSERDSTLTGDLSTSDCEGSNSGTFRFSPRS